MNLGLGGAINLIWDDYAGFDYTTFNINRHTTATGWEQITQLPNSLHSYSDSPIDYDGLWYSVTVDIPSECAPTAESKASGGPYYQASSNIEDEGSTNTKIEQIRVGNVQVYPNPTSGNVLIKADFISNIEITNINGQSIFKETINKPSVNFDLSDFAKGIYFIKLVNKESSSIHKLILE